MDGGFRAQAGKGLKWKAPDGMCDGMCVLGLATKSPAPFRGAPKI